MKQWFWRIVLLAVVGVAVWFGWRWLFPSPQRVIRKQLTELAKCVSFGPNESRETLAEKMNFLTNTFSPDVVVTINLRGQSSRNFGGRDLLLAAAEGAREAIGYLSVEFVDVSVDVGADKTSAVVNLTAKGKVLGDLQVQELKLVLQKAGDRWVITSIETVKTLSLHFRRPPITWLAPAAA